MKKKQDGEIELPEFLTKKQVAGVFSVSTKTVERMMQAGLASVKIRGRRYVSKSQLQDYIDKTAKSA